ncbi:MAG TPA: endo alpha-1,4 polygalactosaminidase [Jatrophihabitantaceae bacterium]|nr:endo alpha-1,4 polygalactosaminidase [Jatrophihabitantaceae bacterium]
MRALRNTLLRGAAGALLLLIAQATHAAPSAAPASTVRSTPLPPPGARFSYQLGGAYRPPAGVRIVDRDRHDAPARGHYNICYLNAFQAQPDELRWWRRHHPGLLLRRHGHLVVDADWGEALLDVGTAARRRAVARVEFGWIDGCARHGFQAIEADNLDSYTRSHHLLSAADALAFARLLIGRAHRDGLAIAQKNAAELSSAAHRSGFDFAVAEECQVYRECGSYTRVYGREVIEIEYTDEPAAAFAQACRRRGRSISITRRDRDLLPAGSTGHVEQWCPAG